MKAKIFVMALACAALVATTTQAQAGRGFGGKGQSNLGGQATGTKSQLQKRDATCATTGEATRSGFGGKASGQGTRAANGTGAGNKGATGTGTRAQDGSCETAN